MLTIEAGSESRTETAAPRRRPAGRKKKPPGLQGKTKGKLPLSKKGAIGPGKTVSGLLGSSLFQVGNLNSSLPLMR